jgi:hypothetical protein
MSRSQRHLREVQGFDSAGQSTGVDGGFVTDPGKVSFSGSIANDVGNQSVAYSLNVSGNFIGSDLPFTYTLQAGTLPSGTTLGSSTGIISGTPDTITNYTGIVIRATDNSGDTADTNAFAIDIQA